jgi:hypothetical protein
LVGEKSRFFNNKFYFGSTAEPPRKAAAAMIGCPTLQSPKTDKHLAAASRRLPSAADV